MTTDVLPRWPPGNAKESLRRLLPARIASHRILAGPLRGRKIVTSWHDYPGAILGATERPLLDWFIAHVSRGATWLDVGAHYGYTALALAELVGNRGRVFAFEPAVATAGCLARTRAMNRLPHLAVIPLGLGSQRELKASRLPAVRGMADSTLGSSNPLWETIYTASLDNLWPTLAPDNGAIDGVKIDVQGMELAVLQGMREVLRRWTPLLIVEFHCGVERRAVLELLQAAGYSTAAEAIDRHGPAIPFADDQSYVFRPLSSRCVS